MLASPIIRAMLSKDTLSLTKIMDEGYIVILNLSGITEDDASLIGGLVTASLVGLALERPHGKRRPFRFIIDECDTFINPSIPKALAETRKFGLSGVLAAQYETQLVPSVLDAVLANCATVVSFRLGADVKRIGARLDMPEANELRRLDDYNAVVHTVSKHEPIRKTIKTFPTPDALGRLKYIKRNTKAVFSGSS